MYNYIYNRIRYLISLKSVITDIISHNYAEINVDSYDSLPLEKTMTFHNVAILIKSVFNKEEITATLCILRKSFIGITKKLSF